MRIEDEYIQIRLSEENAKGTDVQIITMLTRASTTSNFAIRIDRVDSEMRKRINGTVFSRRSEVV